MFYEEGSNASIFFASTMSLFFKTSITQNLKLKSQNKTVRYDLHHFIYAHVKNYNIQFCFGCHQELLKKVLMWIISRRCFFSLLIHISTKPKCDNFL